MSDQRILTREQIIEKCPVVAVQEPTRDVSDKYVHISSLQVIDDIMDFGWVPTKTSMRGKGQSKYCKHSITFERPDLTFGVNSKVDTVIPRVEFFNSHDGLSTFRFYAGLYRLACTNGLVVPIKSADGVELAQSVNIRHIHYNIEELSTTLKTVLASVQSSVGQIFDFADRVMSIEERRLFAKYAYLRRSRVKPAEVAEMLKMIPNETADALLIPERAEDEGDNAWVVLNTVQEKAVRGFEAYNPFIEKTKKHKPLQGFEKILQVNQDLYSDLLAIAN